MYRHGTPKGFHFNKHMKKLEGSSDSKVVIARQAGLPLVGFHQRTKDRVASALARKAALPLLGSRRSTTSHRTSPRKGRDFTLVCLRLGVSF